MDDTFKKHSTGGLVRWHVNDRIAAGGERGVMSRTMHKTYFKKDSPVLFSFVLCFDTKVYKYRSTGTLLTEKAGKCSSWRYGSTKTRQERLTFCFFLDLYARSSIAAPQIPAQAPDWLWRWPPRSPAAQQHSPMPEKRCIWRRSRKLSNKERGTNLLSFLCPSGWLLLLSCFYRIDKDIPFPE